MDGTRRPPETDTPPLEQSARAALLQVMTIRREVERFERRWPEAPGDDSRLPVLSWGQLERQLADLAGTPEKAAMARELVSATRKMARFKPAEMVLREILCLTWALLDEDFSPDFPPDTS